MNSRIKIYKLVLAAVALGLISWIGFTAYQGLYLEAVAISGVSSVLLWFALGAGTKRDED